MKNITQENVLGSLICLPPIEEQNAMIEFFKKETSTIETLISKYQKQIDLMQEYRTALISQAVTGKIDVREWKPKNKEKTS
jgi:type I restriction enzyme S subunit